MTPLQEFLSEHRIPFQEGGSHKHVRYGWTGVQCPWCRTSSWHLGIRNGDGSCTCWRCGKHRLGDVLMRITGLSWGDVKEVVEKSTRGSLSPSRIVSHPSKVIMPRGVGPLSKAHLTYIRSRGFDPDYLTTTWGVQGIDLAVQLSWRLFIPIIQQNTVVSWTTRTIGKSDAIRYISASPVEESISHKEVLYGADYATHSIVVVEGPTDVWRIGPGAGATFGLNVSYAQLIEIGSYPVRAICFDNSPEAQNRALYLANQLKTMPGETHVIRIESGDDPGSMDEEEVLELRGRFLDN